MVPNSSCRTLAIALALTAAGSAQAATLNLLGTGNRLVSVDSAAPGTITSTVALNGIEGNEQLLGIDYRPASPRVLYGLSTAGRLYAINPLTGGAVAVGAPVTFTGVAAGVDFNPSVDRLRVVSNTNQNLRLNPDTGALAATDASLAYAPGDANAGFAPRIAGAAYTNNSPGATPTTLYVIDTNRGVLATQGSVDSVISPNGGQLFTVGALGVATNDTVGFDIARDGTVLATLVAPGSSTTQLYSINLSTGAATLIGGVGAAGSTYLGLAIAAPTIASYAATANQQAIGIALDNFVGVPSAGLNSLFVSLDGLAPAARGAALNQLTPGAYALLPTLTLQTAAMEEVTLQRYLRDFRDGGVGGNATGNGNVGSFIIATSRSGRFDAAADRPQVDYGNNGVMAGIDYRFGSRSLVGITGGYDEARVRLGSAVSNSRIKNWFAGGYGTLGLGPAYVDVFGTYGEADYDLRRAVRFGSNAAGDPTTSLDFTATTRSRVYLGGGTLGIQLKLGAVVLEPFAGARYARVKIDGFSEGTGIAALSLSDTEFESILGNFGAKLGGEYMIGSARFRPEVRGAWRREFSKDGSNGFGFGFAGTGGTTALPFTPTALGRSYYTAGAGFTVSGDRTPVSMVVDYIGEFGRDRSIHGITGGLRLAF